jgi:hypothetical protein
MFRIDLAASSIILAFAVLFPLRSQAAESDGVVTGTGMVAIKRLPQVLRGQFVVTGQAKDLPGAVSRLKEAQASASRKLVELGAAEKSIEVGPTQLGAGPADARAQYTQYMQELQRMMGQAGVAKTQARPQFTIVCSTLKAEWPLTAAGADELFVAGYALQEKIKSAGIGRKDLKKLTPEELEAAEEAGAKAGAGEPVFQYLCKVSEADRAAALAEAYEKAKHDAASLARAAGSELAALRHVSSLATSPTAVDDTDQVFKRMMSQQMMGGAPAPTPTETPAGQAGAPGPTPVELQITVTASFSIK